MHIVFASQPGLANSRLEGGQLHIISAVERQVSDLLFVDKTPDGSGCGLHQRCIRGHGDSLTDIPRAEDDVQDPCRTHRQLDSILNQGLKSHQLGGHLVGPYCQAGGPLAAFITGDGGSDLACLHLGQNDGDPG